MKEIIERAERMGYECSSRPLIRFLEYLQAKTEAKEEPEKLLIEQYEKTIYIELCLIQKWLRENKGLYLFIRDGFDFYIVGNKNNNFRSSCYYKFEEALEEGIKKALEILEKL